MPDMLSDYTLILWGWAYPSIWELFLQIDCNWHSYWSCYYGKWAWVCIYT